MDNNNLLRPRTYTPNAPMFSESSAQKHYQRLINTYNTDIGNNAVKVVVFKHNLEHEILKEITGQRIFKTKFDPDDKDKPIKDRKVLEKGQLDWLYKNKENISYDEKKAACLKRLQTIKKSEYIPE